MCAFQCNRYGLLEKCPCSPMARYSVMIQSKVSHSPCFLCLVHIRVNVFRSASLRSIGGKSDDCRLQPSRFGKYDLKSHFRLRSIRTNHIIRKLGTNNNRRQKRSESFLLRDAFRDPPPLTKITVNTVHSGTPSRSLFRSQDRP